ncbi:hypothetical protein FKM82_026119 [Ascaphus truei]
MPACLSLSLPLPGWIPAAFCLWSCVACLPALLTPGLLRASCRFVCCQHTAPSAPLLSPGCLRAAGLFVLSSAMAPFSLLPAVLACLLALWAAAWLCAGLSCPPAGSCAPTGFCCCPPPLAPPFCHLCCLLAVALCPRLAFVASPGPCLRARCLPAAFVYGPPACLPPLSALPFSAPSLHCLFPGLLLSCAGPPACLDPVPLSLLSAVACSVGCGPCCVPCPLCACWLLPLPLADSFLLCFCLCVSGVCRVPPRDSLFLFAPCSCCLPPVSFLPSPLCSFGHLPIALPCGACDVLSCCVTSLAPLPPSPLLPALLLLVLLWPCWLVFGPCLTGLCCVLLSCDLLAVCSAAPPVPDLLCLCYVCSACPAPPAVLLRPLALVPCRPVPLASARLCCLLLLPGACSAPEPLLSLPADCLCVSLLLLCSVLCCPAPLLPVSCLFALSFAAPSAPLLSLVFCWLLTAPPPLRCCLALLVLLLLAPSACPVVLWAFPPVVLCPHSA